MGNEELQRQGQIELNARLAELLGNNDAQANFEIINPIQQQKNLNGIFDKVPEKLGPERMKQSGRIALRVLRDIINDGSLCDDDLIQEYYAGILAGSKTSDCKDDSALPIVSVLKTMSGTEIVLHYIIYRGLYETFKTSKIDLATDSGKLSLFIPWSINSNILGYARAITKLIAHDLIGQYCHWGRIEHLKKINPNLVTDATYGVYIIPSFLGAEMFMFAHGINDVSNRFFNYEFEKRLFELPSGIIALNK